MAFVELVAAFLMVHFYFVEVDGDSGFGLADGPTVVATGVYIVAVVLVVKVALVGSEQLVHSEVVLDAVLLVVADSVYFPT